MATKEERNRGIDMQQAFSVLPNQILLDNRLDNESKIIWAYIQGKPKDWDFSAYRIAKQINISEKTVRKYLIQLEEFGYLVRNRQCSGRVEYYLHCPPKDEPSGNNYLEGEKPIGKKAPQQKSPAEDFTAVSKKDSIVIKNISNKDSEANASQDKVSLFIDLFKEVNPSHSRLFANKTERAASQRLIDKFGEEKMCNTVKALRGIINEPYAPKITTPYQLERELGKLIVFINQKKKSNVGIIL